MLHSKNTITAKTKKKNIDRFLAVLFFVLVTAGALGNIFGIGYYCASTATSTTTNYYYI
jgi:hypothetical protein